MVAVSAERNRGSVTDGDRGAEADGSRGPEAAEERERDARPPTLAVVSSLVAATVATVAALVADPTGGAVVGASVVCLAGGSLLGSARVLSWGAAAGIGGIALAAAFGGGAEPLLVAGVALAVAWDVADHGLSVGRQVGRKARTRRNVAVHAGTTLLAGTISAGVVYGTYVVAAGGQPIAALALLCFGGVVLASAFR
ncbi:hypothetical protein SAMN04488066_103102 [Halorubrum aquaticum]|uniref:Uncharacterized protein n=1 Tax=Halorubrum aquaticum TaxID=387340 RepID=A0A1I2ZT28_9EURY|nr:hypothetical protein SAMN04488066_103102 [Halorubrum aquaticum]